MERFTITVIGAGAMGGATVRGLVADGFPAGDITVSGPHREKLTEFEQLGCKVTTDNVEAMKAGRLVILAVKPWVLPEVIDEFIGEFDPYEHEVAVIVAGVNSEELKSFFAGDAPECLSIVMPNTAITLRRSMTFMVELGGESVLAKEVYSRLGALKVIEERQLPAATALASCGIAYAMRYVRAAVEGGVQLGFRASEAQEIVVETIKGAAALLSEPGAHPEVEIDKVTTPGGLTIRGLNAMEGAGFTPAVIAGLNSIRN